MPSNQNPSAPKSHLPLDVLLAVDVDVGWQVGLTVLPGKTPPGDAFPLTDPDNVTHVFEAEYNALMADPEGVRVLKEAAANALMLRHVDIGTEFYLKDFGSSFYRVALCYECPGRLECSKCNKTGYITEVYQPYLVGLCYVKEAQETRDPGSVEQPGAKPVPDAAPPARRASPKRWSWSVLAAALATLVMAISIGLRFMYDSEGPKSPPEPAVMATPSEAPVQPPSSPAEPSALRQAPLPPASSATEEVQAPAPPPPAPPLTVKDEPRETPPVPDAPPRKPAAVPPVAPGAGSPAKTGSAVAKSAPVVRLQTALAQLGLYRGPVNGVFDGPTHQGLSKLLSMVPPRVRAQYGLRSAALAEAAARHEFPLNQQ